MTPFIGLEIIAEPFSSMRGLDEHRRKFIGRIALHVLANSPRVREICLRQVKGHDLCDSFPIWSTTFAFLTSHSAAIYSDKIPEDITYIAEQAYEAANDQSMAMGFQTKFILCFYDGMGLSCGAVIFSIKERQQVISRQKRGQSKNKAPRKNLDS